MKTLTLSDACYNELASLFSPTSGVPTSPAAPVVPDGYVLIPATGHVVAKAIDADYSFWGYVLRTAPVEYRALPIVQEMWLRWTEAKGSTPTREQWPECLDWFINDPKLKADREAAKAEQAKQQWVAVGPAPASSTETI